MAGSYRDLQDNAAEESLLCTFFLKNDLLLETKVTESDFARPSHALIFRAMDRLYRSGSVCDMVTVVNSLRDRGLLEEAGGLDGVTAVLRREPTAAGFSRYEEIVLNYSQRRELHHIGVMLASEAIDGTKDISDVVNMGLSHLNEVQGQESEETEIVSAKAVAIAAPGRIYSGISSGIKTGYRDLDNKLCYGLRAGELVVLAARPSMGKTALSLCLAMNAMVQKKRVMFFSLETGTESIGTRLIQVYGGLTQADLRGIDRDGAAQTRLNMAADWLCKNEQYLSFNTGGNHTVDTIQSLCRRVRQRQGLDMVIIDHLQLITAKGFRNDRQAEITYISRRLKQLAKELGCPVLVLSQLNRAVENREDKRPRLADLRESGAIEQDADIVMMMYRKGYYKPEDDDGRAEIIVAKQKDGATGTVSLVYMPEFMRFLDVPDEESFGKQVENIAM